MKRLSLLQSLGLTVLVPAVMFAFTLHTEMVEMRDGVSLSTLILLPDVSSGPFPVILERTPYSPMPDSSIVEIITDVFHYAFVVQNLRGTFDSEGEPRMFLTDGWGTLKDGYDCIDWVAHQDWCDGNIGMEGASAPGMTQYMAAGEPHPNLKCIVPILAGPSIYDYVAYDGGVFRKALVETWLNGLGTPDLIDTVVAHSNYDAMWSTVNLAERWDIADIPAFHVSGWYDMYTDGQIDAFQELQRRFHNQKLLIAPFGHGSATGVREQGDLVYPPNAVLSEDDIMTMAIQWYNYWLKGEPTGIMGEPAVEFYLTGDCDTEDTTMWNKWMFCDTFPPNEMEYKSYYLNASGVLDTIVPDIDAADTFVYDPSDPCPTIGGREYVGLTTGYGPKDQTPIEGRSDVLVYSTPVLLEPVEVIGKLKFVLYGASDRLDTDWAIRVTDVYPDGRSILMTDNILMARHLHGFDIEELLTPGVPDTFVIDVWSIAHVFNVGHRIRVIVSSSNYPRFEINPNTGVPVTRDPDSGLIATNIVYRSSVLPSHLLLPVVPFGWTSVAERNSAPKLMSITCSPNPFNSSCVISGVPEGVQLSIYDIRGNVVHTMLVGAGLAPARNERATARVAPTTNTVIWTPDKSVPSGIYLVRATTQDGQSATKRIVYLK